MFSNTKYYEILGVSKNTLPADLEKAYREAAMKPDRGDDPEKLQELAQAYQVLSDPVKRRMYDQYVGGSSSRGLGKRMRQDVAIPLMVSLAHMYNGESQKLPFLCHVICSKCNGTGVTIDDKDRCRQCKGGRSVPEKRVLEVRVEKGMQSGQQILFSGEALKTFTGEGIIFTLVQREHPKFRRNGDDLFVEHTLSLTEALCGFQFVLTHLDNRQLVIRSDPGEVVKPGQFKEINDEGMPTYRGPLMRGKLYIHFTVEFPDSLTPDQTKAIEAVLSPRPSPELNDMEEVETESFSFPNLI